MITNRRSIDSRYLVTCPDSLIHPLINIHVPAWHTTFTYLCFLCHKSVQSRPLWHHEPPDTELWTNNEIKFFEWRQLSTLPSFHPATVLFPWSHQAEQARPVNGLLLLYFSGFWLEIAICQGQVTCSGHQIITPVTFKPLTILISQHGNDSDMDGGNQCWIWLMRALIITLINYLHNSDLTRSNNYRSLLYFLIDGRYSNPHYGYKGLFIKHLQMHLEFLKDILHKRCVLNGNRQFWFYFSDWSVCINLVQNAPITLHSQLLIKCLYFCQTAAIDECPFRGVS